MPEEMAMVIDAKTKQWEGEIPKGVRQVCMQYLDAKEGWQPPLQKAMPRNVKESIENMERLVARGPCKHTKYRLVPAPSSRTNLTTTSEEDEMAKKKKVAKKTTKKVSPRDTSQLLMGKFRPDSVGGRMVALLMDGKARTAAEIAKVVKPKSVENITSSGGWYSLLKKFGEESGYYDMAKSEEGKIQLTMNAAGKKAAAGAAKPNSHDVSANGAEANGSAKKSRKAGGAKKKSRAAAPPAEDADEGVEVEA